MSEPEATAKGDEARARPSLARMYGIVMTVGLACALVIDKADPAEYAEQWVADNEDMVLGWLTQ